MYLFVGPSTGPLVRYLSLKAQRQNQALSAPNPSFLLLITSTVAVMTTSLHSLQIKNSIWLEHVITGGWA